MLGQLSVQFFALSDWASNFLIDY